MLCKYCGKLLTTKKTCLCCGSHNSKGKVKKLTPEQIKEYELALAKREEEIKLAQEAKIQAEKEKLERKNKKYGKLFKIGLVATAVPLLVTLIALIVKLIYPSLLDSYNVHSLGDNAYSIGMLGFLFGFITSAFTIVTLVFSIMSGKKRWWILIVAVAMVPVAFMCGIVNNGNDTVHLVDYTWDTVKTTYTVGEELDVTGLTIYAEWQSKSEEFKVEDYNVVIVDPDKSTTDVEIEGTKKGTIYIVGFDTTELSNIYEHQSMYIFVCNADNVDNLYYCPNFSVSYKVINS